MSVDYLRTISRQRLEIEQAISELGAGLGRRFVADAVIIWKVLCTWQRRAEDRQRLAGMSADQLADIGLTRAQADHEANKVFWRP